MPAAATSNAALLPKLTILIPTYHRAEFAAHLVRRLLAEGRGYEGEYEILVSDNCSPDLTRQAIETIVNEGGPVRYHRHEEHMASGEENLLEAIPYARGDFIWTMSDDDEPVEGALANVLELVSTDKFDFLVLNLVMMKTDGSVLNERLVHPTGFPEVMTYTDMVRNFGYVTMCACFSAAVFRRSMIPDHSWRRFTSIAPIYSHTAFYLSCFGDARAHFVETPLVRYRFEGTPISAWGTVAKSKRQQFYFPWGNGLARLFKILRAESCIDASFLPTIVELGGHNQFNLSMSLLQTFCDQLTRWIEKTDDIEQISVEEFDEFADEFVSCPQYMISWLTEMRSVVIFLNAIFESVAGNRLRNHGAKVTVASMLDAFPRDIRLKLRQHWLGAIKSKIESMKFRLSIGTDRIESVGGYEIFRVADSYYAVPPTSTLRNARVSQFFEALARTDPQAARSDSIVGLKAILRERELLAQRSIRFLNGMPISATVTTRKIGNRVPNEASRSLLDDVRSKMVVRKIVDHHTGISIGGHGGENLLRWSDDLLNAAWQPHGLIASALGDGRAAIAFALFETGSGDHILDQAFRHSGDTVVVSVKVKAGVRHLIWVRLVEINADIGVVFDLASRSVVRTVANNSHSLWTKVEELDLGWIQVSFAARFETVAGDLTLQLIPLDYATRTNFVAESSPALFVKDPQVSRGELPTTYRKSNDAPAETTTETIRWQLPEETSHKRLFQLVMSIPTIDSGPHEIAVFETKGERAVVRLLADGPRLLLTGSSRAGAAVSSGAKGADVVELFIQIDDESATLASRDGLLFASIPRDVIGPLLSFRLGGAKVAMKTAVGLYSLFEMVDA
ncbi:glycosyltransferase involved in cell wall biosynthesis [Sphingomonas vulcanisoli]|uniref:Glycosyltransferase involved in cell wall biosynthesis n=1 Tax=Sphingomonas vulcanisoli TaxID=1658060 RepID=A0ABX0TVC3_9SPHN|nr:glycosyltransferase family 2 protein [Sphingomonas vulcanisoli]NIJ09448.1 glycosyltransferase involved in cell wall biosynthesis [Sphingomonas vulcanisoli]